ncbi:MAG: hypothetical protein VKJ64_13705, partial [Leptolyngbyaceae bacterium]|nr:hypothetical protein [Leptolyngbyaceae bacterium]
PSGFRCWHSSLNRPGPPGGRVTVANECRRLVDPFQVQRMCPTTIKAFMYSGSRYLSDRCHPNFNSRSDEE